MYCNIVSKSFSFRGKKEGEIKFPLNNRKQRTSNVKWHPYYYQVLGKKYFAFNQKHFNNRAQI